MENLLNQLDPNTEPAFGLMTAQHMIEHLAVSIKTSVKQYGDPDTPLTEKQMGFHRFIEKGAILQHRPSSKTKADLPELKYDSFEEALKQIPEAIDRFYTHFETYSDFKPYNPFFGSLTFEQLELFHYQHVRYHFWQFGLIAVYP